MTSASSFVVEAFVPALDVSFVSCSFAVWYATFDSSTVQQVTVRTPVVMLCSSAEQGRDLSRCQQLSLEAAWEIWTPFSALPFDCAYRGLDVTCLKSYCSANSCHSLLLKHGPLSFITVFGVPCLAKWILHVLWHRLTMCLIAMPFQGSLSDSQWPPSCLFSLEMKQIHSYLMPWCCWHFSYHRRLFGLLVSVFLACFTSAYHSLNVLIPGQKTVSLALLLHFSTPRWPSWTLCSMSRLNFCGMTILLCFSNSPSTTLSSPLMW